MNSLYLLVKALEKSEKRYFKIFASRHVIGGKKHEIELFDAIEKVKYPTDSSVKAQIKNKQLLKNFSLHKHLLYKSLLRCLNTYHAGNTIEDEILEMYRSGRILFEKCLFEESKKMIEKAKVLALEYECFGLYLMLCETENIFHEYHFDLKQFEEKILNQSALEKDVLAKLQNLIEYRNVNNQLHFHTKRFGVMDKNLIRRYLPILPDLELISEEKKAASTKALAYYWKVRSLMAYRDADYDLSTHFEEKILRWYKTKDNHYPFKMLEITLTLERMIWNYYMQGNIEKVKELLERVDTIPDLHRNIRLEKFQLYINYQLLTCINTGNTTEAESLEIRMEEAYREMGDAISLQKKLIFNYNLAILFFVAGNYAKCSKWLDTLMAHISKKIDTDIMISARLINIIVQYEMKMYSLIKYSVLSAKRYISKIRPLNDFDHLLFTTLMRLSTHRIEEETIKIMQDFKEALHKIIVSGKDYDRCFPYYQWIEAKIEQLPLARVIWETNVSGKRDFCLTSSS